MPIVELVLNTKCTKVRKPEITFCVEDVKRWRSWSEQQNSGSLLLTAGQEMVPKLPPPADSI